jgi:spore coat protein U-like protein
MRLAFPKRALFGLGVATCVATMPLSWAAAATTTTTFTVTALVQTNCSVTADNLNFGGYTGVLLNGTTTLTATCSNGTPFNLGLDAGTATGATVTTRSMQGPNIRSGGDLLGYHLFQDASHSINWGNTVGTDTVASTGTGAAQTFTVFGQIPAGQFVAAGAYQDLITVTLTF